MTAAGTCSLAIALSLLLAATPAKAGVELSLYEGPDAVQTGTGGTKISKHGVDFWTYGTPPRRYRIIGVLTDTRTTKLLAGKAIGSAGLAKRVLRAGGNALIVVDRDSRYGGRSTVRSPSGNSYDFGSFDKVTTQFLVVRYLEEEEKGSSLTI